MKTINGILKDFDCRKLNLAGARKAIEGLPLVKLSHTRIDMERESRTGVGEVIFGSGKSPKQIVEIMSAMAKRKKNVLVTRISEEAAAEIGRVFPLAKISSAANTASLVFGKKGKSKGKIAIVTAGTSDMRVAEEARETAEFLGDNVETFYDCGVAGIHRLAAVMDKIKKADAVIAIAGMEGALASVLAGLLKVPVIAVPTSVGYGASFGGLAALLSMINSCANGVSIVNIDNGYGAAYNAHLIIKMKK